MRFGESSEVNEIKSKFGMRTVARTPSMGMNGHRYYYAVVWTPSINFFLKKKTKSPLFVHLKGQLLELGNAQVRIASEFEIANNALEMTGT